MQLAIEGMASFLLVAAWKFGKHGFKYIACEISTNPCINSMEPINSEKVGLNPKD